MPGKAQPTYTYTRRLRKQKEKSLTLNQIRTEDSAAVSKKSVSGWHHPVVVQGAKDLKLVGDGEVFAAPT
jgi:hypothetical protein